MTDKIEVLDKGYVRFVNKMGSDLDIANAARVSYDKESPQMSDKDARLIKYLWKQGHTSPFRHCVISFEVYAPLMVARQWYKHAVASAHWEDQNGWNESSRRYITEQEEFYIPAEWREKPENSKQGSGGPLPESENNFWTTALESYIEQGENWYQNALKAGIAPEQARLFLPAYGMYVRWRWTTSLHGVLNFLSLRLPHDAQKEIQEYAAAVQRIVLHHFPTTMEIING